MVVGEERADRQQEEYNALLFEAVLFLEVNSTYWNEYTVKEAMEKREIRVTPRTGSRKTPSTK